MNRYNLKIDCKETMYVQHLVKRKKMLSLPGAGRYHKCRYRLSLWLVYYMFVCFINVCVCVCVYLLFT